MILADTKVAGYVEDSVARAGKGCKCKTPTFYLCYSAASSHQLLRQFLQLKYVILLSFYETAALKLRCRI